MTRMNDGERLIVLLIVAFCSTFSVSLADKYAFHTRSLVSTEWFSDLGVFFIIQGIHTGHQ